MSRYFITKYALSKKGAMDIVESDEVPDERGYIYLTRAGQMFGNTYTLGRDLFTDEGAAKLSILAARDKKILSLKAQIKKLEAIV